MTPSSDVPRRPDAGCGSNREQATPRRVWARRNTVRHRAHRRQQPRKPRPVAASLTRSELDTRRRDHVGNHIHGVSEVSTQLRSNRSHARRSRVHPTHCHKHRYERNQTAPWRVQFPSRQANQSNRIAGPRCALSHIYLPASALARSLPRSLPQARGDTPLLQDGGRAPSGSPQQGRPRSRNRSERAHREEASSGVACFAWRAAPPRCRGD